MAVRAVGGLAETETMWASPVDVRWVSWGAGAGEAEETEEREYLPILRGEIVGGAGGMLGSVKESMVLKSEDERPQALSSALDVTSDSD